MEEEYVDVIDLRNNIIGKTTRSVVHWLGIRHRISAVLLLRKDGKMLHPTALDFSLETGKLFHAAAGHVLSGESYEGCAKREILEEAGIIVDKVKLLGSFWYEGKRGDIIDKERFQIFLAKYHESMGPIKFNEEQINEQWLSKKELKQIFDNNPDLIGGPFRITCKKILGF